MYVIKYRVKNIFRPSNGFIGYINNTNRVPV